MNEAERVLDRGRVSLHYWTGGPPGAPLVVLTHGAATDHRMFDPQVPVLHEHGFRTLRWDVRAHGRSRSGHDRFRVSDAAEDIAALLDRDPDCELHTVPGAGHVANLDRPDIVNRLITRFLEKKSRT